MRRVGPSSLRRSRLQMGQTYPLPDQGARPVIAGSFGHSPMTGDGIDENAHNRTLRIELRHQGGMHASAMLSWRLGVECRRALDHHWSDAAHTDDLARGSTAAATGPTSHSGQSDLSALTRGAPYRNTSRNHEGGVRIETAGRNPANTRP
jgi:hypothetical protein